MRSDATADRAGALICLIGVLVAALSLVLAAIAGPPYLGLSGINGWMIVFAAALLAALIAIPFVLEARLRRSAIKNGAVTDQLQYAFVVPDPAPLSADDRRPPETRG